MKKLLFAISFNLFFSLFSISVFAQTEEDQTKTPVPKWVSDNGYWVVETNVKTPKINTIYFYNNDNVMLYKEKVEGVVIKLKKRSVKMNLKKVLDQSITAYNEKQKASEDQMLVANIIRKH